MSNRRHPFINNYIYHIFNKTIDGKRIFTNEKICDTFLEVIRYYRSNESYLRYSKYRELHKELKLNLMNKIENKNTFRISLLAFTLMPTHYHLILKQNQQNGISFFMSQIQNSLTRFYNLKEGRKGSIFLQTFKSKLIESEAQFKHTTRYVHLNIFSGGLIKELTDIVNYPFSSFNEYVCPAGKILSEPDYALSMFDNNRERYKKFVFDNAEQQKMLEFCKYAKKW